MNKVSIVIVTYNCAKEIEQTLISALSLDYSNCELLVVDGASTDGTIDILEKYRDKFAYYISEPDCGIYDAMNKGIAHANGDWIFFLNAGDVFDDKRVFNNVFKNDLNGVDVIYGDVKFIYEDGIKYKKPWGPFWNSKKLYHGMGFSHQSTLVRLSLAKQFPFDLTFRCCADYNMMTTIYNHDGVFKYLPIAITICEARDGFSARNRLIQMKDTARICGAENSFYFKWIYFKKWVKIKVLKK